MEYIPNALSFVFVISVTSACSMSKDRVFMYTFFVSYKIVIFFLLYSFTKCLKKSVSLPRTKQYVY